MVKREGMVSSLDELQKTCEDGFGLDLVGEIVSRMAAAPETQERLVEVSRQVFRELEDLSRYIKQAKAEIAALRPDEVTEEYLPKAANELDAIVAATAEATLAIMDATERIETVSEAIGSDSARELEEATTRIYEACGFQDITGQRISKVVKALKEIENKVNALVEAFGDQMEPVKGAGTEKTKATTSDGDLLEGPQMPAEASTQADIDRLLAELE